MLRFLTSLPFFVSLIGIGSIAMLVPAVHAFSVSDFLTSRTFFYGSVMGMVLTLLIGIATRGYSPLSVPRSQLMTLLAAFVLLPLIFALPFQQSLRTVTLLDSWFEMVSSFTTTGATLFDNPNRLNPSLHLWRALVGWMGGLLVWVMAFAILAPMNLGGFEVLSNRVVAGGADRHAHVSRISDPSERLARYGARLAPIYAGLTGVLWIILMIAGEVPLVALCHAMAVLSTSGISPLGGLENAASGLVGEIAIFVFFFFAVSRLTFSRGLLGDDRATLWQDPEVQMALALLLIVSVTLAGWHITGAADRDLWQSLLASWAGLFTVLSFITTTGFESRYWSAAGEWSGLDTPGLVLMGLALIGGGVATTAGGVKLLRVYALYKHGVRELERLVHPSSVGGAGTEARRIRRQGAFIAWIFFMLFAVSIMGVMLLLSFTGVQFETAMVLTVAALSTTGPLAQIAADTPISYAGIPETAQAILAVTMILGRLETLALIALFNPSFWRS
jgi:trk system potassium uptake protein